MQDQRPESSAWGRRLGLVVVVGLFVGGAAAFLPRQCLWLDETTQMTGMGLGPVGVVRWLAGGEPHDTGQARDRMPPLSNWMGWAWSRAFGLDEASLRWFGVACVAATAALVYETSRRAFGTASAWVAGLLFALSPSVILLSVEIRAYPLFTLWSALAFYGLVRLQASPPDGRRGAYAALAVALPAAVATHFYGAVLAGSVLAALVVLACRGAGRFRPILGLAGATALAMALTSPFVAASLGLPKDGGTSASGYGPRLAGVKDLVVRLVDHETFPAHRQVTVVAAAAASVLIALAFGVARPSRRPAVAVGLGLGVGLLVVTAAHLVVTHFNAASSHYNVWMRPGFCVLLSAGVASRAAAARRVAALAAGLLLAAELSGAYRLAAHGDSFAHGPHRAIVGVIGARDLGDVAVVHDDVLPRAMLVYYPLRYELGSGLGQYQLVDAPGGPAVLRDYPSERLVGPAAALPHRYLVVVRLKGAGRKNSTGSRPDDDGPVSRVLRASAEWRLVSERLCIAHFTAKIDLFERRPSRPDAARVTRLGAGRVSGTESR